MAHDGEYFRRRADQARAAAFCRDEGEEAEIAGQLALAYSALARRQSLRDSKAEAPPAEVTEA